jgi:hypothetical protein
MANIKKNAKGYNYTYTDLAAVNDYIESIGETYTQEVTTLEGVDYIQTNRKDKSGAVNSLRGCRVVQATLGGKSNAAQEQGSGLTYARRYSLLMAYGLATEDDDGESFTQKEAPKEVRNRTEEIKGGSEPMGTVDPLTQAKDDIKAELIKQGHNKADTMRSFIKSVLGKESIDTIEEARDVAHKLDKGDK